MGVSTVRKLQSVVYSLLDSSQSTVLGGTCVTSEECLALPSVAEAIARGFIVIKNDRVTYKLHRDKEYDWLDPEE